MWANTCPLVDAYSPGRFRRPPPTFFRGPWTGATAERFKGCDARALLRPLLLYCARRPPLSAALFVFIIIIRWWFRDTIELRRRRWRWYIIYYSAEPCAPQCELDDARVSLYYNNCHRTFLSDETYNIRVLCFTAPLMAHRTRRRPLEFSNNSAAHFRTRLNTLRYR